MRVLMIIDGLPGGGAEKSLLTLAQGLISMNHTVVIFSLRDECDFAIPSGVEYKLINDCTNVFWRKLTELSRRARELDKVLSVSQHCNGEFDLVISNLHKTDRIVSRSKILLKDRTWFCLHTIFSLGYLKRHKGFFRWIKRRKIRRVYQHRNIIAVSHDILNDMLKNFNVTPCQAKVIYNPFNFNEIIHLSKAPCDLSNKDYLIHVGRLSENKRQDRLLVAYAKSGIQSPLVIMGRGSGTMIKSIKLIAQNLNIQDRILLKTFNINPYPYIRHARMLILSSDSEGFGNVLVESLICNTPVVSTNCPGGPKEILHGQLSAGLAELNSISLAKTMRLIYNQPPVISLDKLKAYKVEEICKQYIALIKNSTFINKKNKF